jgi:hypothetical protein
MSIKRVVSIWLGVSVTALCVTCAPVERGTPKETETSRVVVPPEDAETLPPPGASGPRERIEAAIQNVRDRDLLTNNGFWTVFHGILGLGPEVTLRNPDTDEKVNALEFIRAGGEMRGLRFLPTKWGLDVETATQLGVSQGHQDQFIAEMIEWGMTPEKTFTVGTRDYTFQDFIHHALMRTRTTQNQELSWAIIVIAQNYGTDYSWTNGYKERLHFNDVVRYELDASVEQAPCGGTHRLFGLCWAYHLHLRSGGKKEGVWNDVIDKTIKYRDLAKRYQNGDGSLSTGWFKEPGNSQDKTARITTTGHMLEWLALALPDDQLKEQWVQDAANALAITILDLQGSPIEGGALYHAVHGLIMYHHRIWGNTVGGPEPVMMLPPKGALDKGR